MPSKRRRIAPIALAVGVLAEIAVPVPAERSTPVPIQPQVDPSRPDWENPAVFAIGKLPARATGFPFESRPLAIAGDPARSVRFLSLDGQWRFSFSPNADDLPKGFERPDFDVSGWKTIRVPSDWQAEGYDQARYNNITYPFPANRPLIPHDRNSVGSYRRDVDLPAAFHRRRWTRHVAAWGAGSSTDPVQPEGVAITGYSDCDPNLFRPRV